VKDILRSLNRDTLLCSPPLFHLGSCYCRDRLSNALHHYIISALPSATAASAAPTASATPPAPATAPASPRIFASAAAAAAVAAAGAGHRVHSRSTPVSATAPWASPAEVAVALPDVMASLTLDLASKDRAVESHGMSTIQRLCQLFTSRAQVN
jgi:hypothetical protein